MLLIPYTKVSGTIVQTLQSDDTTLHWSGGCTIRSIGDAKSRNQRHLHNGHVFTRSDAVVENHHRQLPIAPGPPAHYCTSDPISLPLVKVRLKQRESARQRGHTRPDRVRKATSNQLDHDVLIGRGVQTVALTVRFTMAISQLLVVSGAHPTILHTTYSNRPAYSRASLQPVLCWTNNLFRGNATTN